MGKNEKIEEPVEESGTEDLSLRDSLDAAIDEVDDDGGDINTDGSLPEADEKISPEAGEEPSPEKGEKPAEEVPAEEQAAGEERPDGDGKDLDEKDVAKAPVGWDAKDREVWSKVKDPEIKKIIHRRERQMAEVMHNTARARQTHDFVRGLENNYAQLLAVEGVQNPLQAIEGLFKTTAELRMGSPEQKAQKIAAMVKHYGVDIQALDNALVGNPAQPSEATAMEHMINERMAPVNQLLQELQIRQQQGQQQQYQAAEQEVASFQGEFLSDVRNDMADLIDLAANRGETMSLQQAYDKAILLRPEIQSILQERQRQEEIVGKEKELEQRRLASSSLSGRQGGPGGANEDASLRETLESAWGETGRV